MATKNIVPRATGEGGIGTAVKRWLIGFFNSLDVDNGAKAPVNTLQRSTAYALNDVAFHSGIDAKYFLKCTTAGTTGAALPDFTGVTSDSTVTDGTVVWTVKTLGTAEAFSEYLPLTGGTLTGALTGTDATFSGTITGNVTGNVTGDLTGTASKATNDANNNNIAQTYLPIVVGAVMAFAGSTSPTGWLLCDGSAVSRTDYADLYAVIGDTYGAGDGSTTFNLPNLIDKFVQGNAVAGTEHTAGLPNITGSWKEFFGGLDSNPAEFTGAIYLANTNAGSVGNNMSTTVGQYAHLDASRSSAIYGNSNTVQPPSVTMRYIIKY